MPETTMHQDNCLQMGQDYIGTARKPGDVQTEAEPESMQQRADDEFRLGVLPANRGHTDASLAGGQGVSHGVDLVLSQEPWQTSWRGIGKLLPAHYVEVFG